jgi:hypothetical protein
MTLQAYKRDSPRAYTKRIFRATDRHCHIIPEGPFARENVPSPIPAHCHRGLVPSHSTTALEAVFRLASWAGQGGGAGE